MRSDERCAVDGAHTRIEAQRGPKVERAIVHEQLEAGERQRELSSLNLQPSGSQVAAQIKAKVEKFIESMKTGGAESLEERRNFNNWLMQLNVRVTVLDAKLPMLQWSNTEAVIYRYPSGDIICDETIIMVGAPPRVSQAVPYK